MTEKLNTFFASVFPMENVWQIPGQSCCFWRKLSEEPNQTDEMEMKL